MKQPAPLRLLCVAAAAALMLTSCGGSDDDSSASGGSNPMTEAEKTAAVDAHNAARRNVGVPDLKWNDAAANVAYSYAQEHAAKGCKPLTHSYRKDYGENLARSTGQLSVEDAVALWVAEKESYTPGTPITTDPNALQAWGHYTQIVWRNTTGVGCGSASCSDGGVIVVCNYTPPGNYIGQTPY